MNNQVQVKDEIKNQIVLKLQSLFGRTLKSASENQLYKAVSMVLRDRIMEKWAYSKELDDARQGKQLFYLSMEFLMGRVLGNNLINLGLEEEFKQACQELDVELAELRSLEPNAGLGNGGLGRLAACFLDSLASLNLSGHGNGIRYEYGLFKQKIINGFQVEMPDPWLEDGNVWEVAKPEEPEFVCFGGTVEKRWEKGRLVVEQVNGQWLKAIPYDVPILGYHTEQVNTLRLWGARSLKPLDMGLFGKGQYMDSMAEKELAELISKVLYPEDNHREGKSLRLKQQYFFVSASIQSIVHRYKKTGSPLAAFAEKNVIQINDTHPALAIPELMRILMDQEGFGWEEAWGITSRTFAYTNHTILEEALEKWSVELFQELLPRIYEIIHEINERFCRSLWDQYPGDWDRIAKMAIINQGEIKMAHLCIAGSFSVNGVAALHTKILTEQVFHYFYQLSPEKFISITNGVAHRRFLLKANKRLSALISESITDRWIQEPLGLKEFEKFAEDGEVQRRLSEIRLNKKEKLANYIQQNNHVFVDPHSIFDVQIKRLHEYKRQLLNVLHIMHLYNQLLDDPDRSIHPRTFIFAAKAAPGYQQAKLIIKLIHSLGQRINNDRTIRGQLKVVFLEDYCVSLAEQIIPAADISEQISTAGKEASGTGNMKFMLNGALTVGTLDGANVEIHEQVGDGNIYIFGLTADETAHYYETGTYRPMEIYRTNGAVKRVLDQLVDGFLEPEHPELFQSLYDGLLQGNGGMADPYFVLKDFDAYCNIQAIAGREYAQPSVWWRKSIVNIANGGIFSSDRTIQEYNQHIWGLKPR